MAVFVAAAENRRTKRYWPCGCDIFISRANDNIFVTARASYMMNWWRNRRTQPHACYASIGAVSAVIVA